MFRVGPTYFREISSDTVSDAESACAGENSLRIQLLHALEAAGCRLAIAIAEESKSTPWSRRKWYLDTADQMRRLIGKLKEREADECVRSQHRIQALEALGKIPARDGAQALCKYIEEIVEILQ